MMKEKGLEMEKEDHMLQHWLHGLRMRCVGLFCNGSNDLVRRCVTAWACQIQQCWQPQSLNQTLKIPETMTGHAGITDTSI